MTKANLNLSPPLLRLRDEADAIGASFPAVLTADLVRYRRMADAAVPELTDWQWGLLSHVLDGIEGARIISGDDSLPSAGAIAAEIDAWADSTNDEDTLRAGELRGKAIAWTPMAIAGIFHRLRTQKAAIP